MNLERKIIPVRVGEIELVDNMRIDDLINSLEELKESGAELFDPDSESSFDSQVYGYLLFAYRNRLETDEEYDRRIQLESDSEKAIEQMKEAKEKAEYLRLKSKYEPK